MRRRIAALLAPGALWAAAAVLAPAGLSAREPAPPEETAPAFRLPDLVPLERAAAMHRLSREQNRVRLRFPTAILNIGDGPLEVRGEREKPEELRMRARQVLYGADGGRAAEWPLDDFEYHAAHDHWHLLSVAEYRLRDGSGRVVATSGKVSFCLYDDLLMRPELPAAPKARRYAYCPSDRALRQIETGISVGWADVYASHLDGQFVDVTGLPAGEYRLEIEIDPAARLREKTRANNTISVPVRLEAPPAAAPIITAARPAIHPRPPGGRPGPPQTGERRAARSG